MNSTDTEFEKMRAVNRQQIIKAFQGQIPEDAFMAVWPELEAPTGVETELAPQLKLNTGTVLAGAAG